MPGLISIATRIWFWTRFGNSGCNRTENQIPKPRLYLYRIYEDRDKDPDKDSDAPTHPPCGNDFASPFITYRAPSSCTDSSAESRDEDAGRLIVASTFIEREQSASKLIAAERIRPACSFSLQPSGIGSCDQFLPGFLYRSKSIDQNPDKDRDEDSLCPIFVSILVDSTKITHLNRDLHPSGIG
jgi:hypothetical protein